jgi:glutathione S-transferase
MSSEHNIVLFHYPFSPWARKIRIYLALRKIPYTECHVNMMLPRPVLEQLNINFRLIPVLAIGRDIYTNTTLQLQVLDDFFPASKEHPPLSALHKGKDGQAVGLEKLMEKYTEAMFLPGGASIQPELYEGIDGFKEDRKSLWGRSWDGETQRKGRPEALATIVGCFELLERLLGRGEKWIGSPEPGLVDIHGGPFAMM